MHRGALLGQQVGHVRERGAGHERERPEPRRAEPGPGASGPGAPLPGASRPGAAPDRRVTGCRGSGAALSPGLHERPRLEQAPQTRQREARGGAHRELVADAGLLDELERGALSRARACRA